MNVPSQSFRPAEPSVIEPNCLYALSRELMGDMCSLADIRMVAVVHKNHGLDRFRGRVSICGQLELVPFIGGDCELDEVNVGEGVMALRVSGMLLILLGFENDLKFSLFGQ